MFGCYDQLNCGAYASAEVLVRRVFGIIDAVASGADRADWHNAQYYMGGTSADDLVPMEMKTYVSRRAKDDSEVFRARATNRYVGAAAPTGGDGGGAGQRGVAPPGAQPHPGADPKKKKKKDGKGGGKAPNVGA